MKIAVIAPYSRPFDDSDSEGSGQNIFIRESSLALINTGHSVTIFRRKSRSDDKNVIKKKDLPGEITIKAGPARRLNRIETYKACLEVDILKYIDIAEFDFFIAHYWISEAWVSQISKITTKRIFYFSHSVFLNEYKSIREQRIKLATEIRFKDSVYWCSNTKKDYAYMRSFFSKEKVLYIPPGIGDCKVGAKKDNKEILFVGRKNYAKGFDLFCKLANDFPQYKFESIGRLETTEVKIDNLTQTNFLSVNDLSQKIKNARLVICPSRYEYFGLVPLMSISLGTPVIASTVGGHVEVINSNKTGLLFSPNSYKSLFNVFSNFLDKNIKINNKEIFALKKKFNWNNFVAKIITQVQKPKIVYKGSVVSVSISPKEINKKLINYERVKLPASVHIIPIDKNGKIILLREKKIHDRQYKTRVIAGIKDKDETVQEAAARELLEETGLHAKKWSLLVKISKNNVINDNRYYYIARELTQYQPKPDVTENIKGIVKVDIKELKKLWDKGVFGKLETSVAIEKLFGFYKKI